MFVAHLAGVAQDFVGIAYPAEAEKVAVVVQRVVRDVRRRAFFGSGNRPDRGIFGVRNGRGSGFLRRGLNRGKGRRAYRAQYGFAYIHKDVWCAGRIRGGNANRIRRSKTHLVFEIFLSIPRGCQAKYRPFYACGAEAGPLRWNCEKSLSRLHCRRRAFDMRARRRTRKIPRKIRRAKFPRRVFFGHKSRLAELAKALVQLRHGQVESSGSDILRFPNFDEFHNNGARGRQL